MMEVRLSQLVANVGKSPYLKRAAIIFLCAMNAENGAAAIEDFDALGLVRRLRAYAKQRVGDVGDVGSFARGDGLEIRLQ